MSRRHHRGGRKAAPIDTVRTEQVRASFRPDQVDDLRTIAAGWGVPLGTAVWAIVAVELARLRRETPDLGSAALAISAGLRLLTRAGAGAGLELGGGGQVAELLGAWDRGELAPHPSADADQVAALFEALR